VWGVPILQRQLPSSLPRADEAVVNGAVLAFSIAISLFTGVLFGALPAYTASRRDLVDSLKEGARGSSGGSRWARQTLVVAEVALATVLLVAAGLLVRSVQRLQLVELGFQSDNVTTAMIGTPRNRYPEHAQQWSFYQRLMQRLSVSPGVQSVALSSGAPFGGGNTGMPVTAEGASRLGTSSLQTDWRMVTPNYFSTMGIPLVRGRFFQDSDREGAPFVLIVSTGMARRIWGDEDPIGRRIMGGPNQYFRIVGVVGDVRNLDLSLEPNPTMYVSATQSLWPTMTIIVRGLKDAAAAAPLMRQAVKELDPQLALYNVRSMDLLLDQSAAQPRVIAWLVGMFAIVAVFLSAVGIYGVLAYLVSQRVREIGIRMALGARPGSVLGLFLSRGLRLVGVGLAAGLVAAGLLTRAMSSLLFGVRPFDLLTFASATCLLGLIALIASYVPARRATRVDPLIALRAE
jgi:putative ABC transport system permease protein